MLKVIIAGGRNFADYQLLCIKCNNILKNKNPNEIEIVSGNAKGADMFGEKYAKEKGLSQKIFKADWDKNGKSAGFRRNEQMAEYADALIAFWDGSSKGTAHMIKLAKEKGLLVRVIKY